jgi:hypothetical protein
MSVRTATAFLNSFLVFAAFGLSDGANQKRQQVPLSPGTSVESSDDSLSKALLRIELNLKQIAEDINAVAGRIPSKTGDGDSHTAPVAPKIHELLKNDDPATLVRDFFQASQDRLRFESCLKSGKLYRNLAAEILRTGTPESRPSTLGDEFAQTAQLFFLSRMIPELELQYAELQPQARTPPDAERAELWSRFRDALRQDDQLLLGKLLAHLSSTGDSPNQLAIRVLSQAQRTSPSLGSTIAASMAILDSVADVWKLADVPGMNPDFLNALECAKRAMKGIPAPGSRAALLQAIKCKTSADGSSVQAFTGSQAHPSQSTDTSKAPASLPNEVPHRQDIFHVPTEKELQDLQRQDSKSDAVPAAPGQPPAFGVSNTPVKRPKIPSWWIRCACPSDHPDAGIVFEGIRWHAPVLQCPNPELRRLEIK